MRTWTTYQSDYIAGTNNDTDNVNRGKIWINDSIRAISSIRNGKWKWLEDFRIIDTVALQQDYQVPNIFRKLVDLWITIGNDPTTNSFYMPIPIYDPVQWKFVLASRLGFSDYTRFYYLKDSTIQFWPIPASTGNKINMRGRLAIRNLSIDDYTTGGILTATKNSTQIVGVGTSWTRDMAGRAIRITETSSNNGGDGFWYRIDSVQSATQLTLVKPYLGESISAGNAAYVIGQTAWIPEAYDIAVLYRSWALYWDWKRNKAQSDRFWRMYDGGVEAGLSQVYGGIIGQMCDEEGATVEGPYISPNSSVWWNPNYPQPDSPPNSFS